jgi:hypothetical protein
MLTVLASVLNQRLNIVVISNGLSSGDVLGSIF